MKINPKLIVTEGELALLQMAMIDLKRTTEEAIQRNPILPGTMNAKQRQEGRDRIQASTEALLAKIKQAGGF